MDEAITHVYEHMQRQGYDQPSVSRKLSTYQRKLSDIEYEISDAIASYIDSMDLIMTKSFTSMNNKIDFALLVKRNRSFATFSVIRDEVTIVVPMYVKIGNSTDDIQKTFIPDVGDAYINAISIDETMDTFLLKHNYVFPDDTVNTGNVIVILNANTAYEVFTRRAEEAGISQRYADLALDSYLERVRNTLTQMEYDLLF